MSRQFRGALVAFVLIAAFVTSIVLRSLIGAVIVALVGVSIWYVLAIALMRTNPDRVRNSKQETNP